MVRAPDGPSTAPSSARWAFQPRARPDSHREDATAFQRRIAAALCTAHGLGVEFCLRLLAGPEPLLVLETGNAVAHRWATRAFIPAYDRHQWVAGALAFSQEGGARFRGRRLRPWPHPLWVSREPPALLDVWALAFSSLTPGVLLDLRFRPVPSVPKRWWEASHVLQPASPPNPRLRGDSGTPLASAGRSGSMELERPLARGWILSIQLGCSRSGEAEAASRRAATALEQVARSEAANGIVFSSPTRLCRGGEAGFFVAEEELVHFLPGPECPVTLLNRPHRTDVELLPLGRTVAGTVVGPPIETDQGRHLAVLGETGMGKSSLLVALARRVSRKHGLILLDPVGATAAALERELDPSATARLVRIAPVHSEVRVNALEGIAGEESTDVVRSERRLSDLVYALRRVRSSRYADSAYWGPRLEEMLTRAVRAAARFPDGTLADAHTLLATGARFHREVPPEALGPVRELAERIRSRPEDAEGARRLLYELVRNPVLERMLCAREPDFSTSELVRPGRVVLISGGASVVGESTARYLLSVYLALVWSEVLCRSVPSKTFLVLDEAQWFSHESLAEMLRLGRSANLHVVLATQALAALPEGVRESVWTNVADFVAFRGSPEEARELARAARGVTMESILSLPRGQAAVLLGKGNSVRWLRTLRIPVADGAHRPDADSRAPELPSPGTANPPDARTRAPVQTGELDPRPLERSSFPPVTVEKVMAFLRSRAEPLPRGARLRVALSELRQMVDPEGRAIRSAGSLLGQAHAIESTERTESGTVWTIDPERIPPPRGPGTDGGSSEGSSAPQPS
jgi:DNA helicase HerA-like ATPase